MGMGHRLNKEIWEQKSLVGSIIEYVPDYAKKSYAPCYHAERERTMQSGNESIRA